MVKRELGEEERHTKEKEKKNKSQIMKWWIKQNVVRRNVPCCQLSAREKIDSILARS